MQFRAIMSNALNPVTMTGSTWRDCWAAFHNNCKMELILSTVQRGECCKCHFSLLKPFFNFLNIICIFSVFKMHVFHASYAHTDLEWVCENRWNKAPEISVGFENENMTQGRWVISVISIYVRCTVSPSEHLLKGKVPQRFWFDFDKWRHLTLL